MNRTQKATIEHEVDDQIVFFKISNMTVACQYCFFTKWSHDGSSHWFKKYIYLLEI